MCIGETGFFAVVFETDSPPGCRQLPPTVEYAHLHACGLHNASERERKACLHLFRHQHTQTSGLEMVMQCGVAVDTVHASVHKRRHSYLAWGPFVEFVNNQIQCTLPKGVPHDRASRPTSKPTYRPARPGGPRNMKLCAPDSLSAWPRAAISVKGELLCNGEDDGTSHVGAAETD